LLFWIVWHTKIKATATFQYHASISENDPHIGCGEGCSPHPIRKLY